MASLLPSNCCRHYRHRQHCCHHHTYHCHHQWFIILIIFIIVIIILIIVIIDAVIIVPILIIMITLAFHVAPFYHCHQCQVQIGVCYIYYSVVFTRWLDGLDTGLKLHTIGRSLFLDWVIIIDNPGGWWGNQCQAEVTHKNKISGAMISLLQWCCHCYNVNAMLEQCFLCFNVWKTTMFSQRCGLQVT